MGQTLSVWLDRVAAIVADISELDVSSETANSVGLDPALAMFSIDRPRRVTIEKVGAGSAYIALPTAGDGWVPGFSAIDVVEHPARENPPQLLDSQSWTVTRSETDVTAEKLLLYDASPSASEYVRVTFTTSWPTPTNTAADDKVDAVAFHAVAHLAASFCLQHLAAQASRARSGALPTAFADGATRARELREQAAVLRGVYDTYLGRAPSGTEGGSMVAPSSRPFDFDPSYESLFHGRRR